MNEQEKLREISDLVYSLDLDGAKIAVGLVQKIVEMKEFMVHGAEKLSESRDEEAAVSLRDLREVLDDQRIALSGPEAVLLASLLKHHEQVETLDSRSINVLLGSYHRKPANTTSTVESLEKRGLVEVVSGDQVNAHKKFRLTMAGVREAGETFRLYRKQSLSVVS